MVLMWKWKVPHLIRHVHLLCGLIKVIKETEVRVKQTSLLNWNKHVYE